MRRGLTFAAGLVLVIGAAGCPAEDVTQDRDTDEDTTSSTTSGGPTGGSRTSDDSNSSDPTNASDPTDPTDPSTSSTTDPGTTSDGTGSTSDGSGTSGSTGGPGGFDCADGVLGGNLPETQTGSLSDADGDDFTPPINCTDGSGGYDVAFEWTAPSTGTFVIGTLGSAIDTVLYAYDACGGSVLACNDDLNAQNMIFQSAFPIDLEAGQTILIVVDGYDDLDVGDYELAIENN